MATFSRKARLAVGLAVFPLLGSLLMAGPGGQSAQATGPSVSWGGSTTLDEQGGASSINSSSISITGDSFDSGYIDFAVGGATSSDVLSVITSDAASTGAGEVSIVGSSVFLGNGSTADNVGSVDETLDGTGGNSLRLNFVNSFPNASFELDNDGDTSVTGWTTYNQQVILGSTVIEGFKSVDTGNYPNRCSRAGDDDDGVYTSWNSGASWQATVTDSQANAGSKSLELALSASANSGGWFLRGPAAASSEFQASSGDTISFDWRSVASGDRYSAFGYLLNTSSGAQTEILDEVGASGGLTTPWTTKTVTIPATGTYKFVFVAGAYNGDCGQQGSGALYIDNVVVVGDKVTAAVATEVAQLVRYNNSSDNPTTSRTVTLTAVDGASNTATATTSIVINPLNDAPSIDGDGDTTAIAKTVVELDGSSVDSPIADITGTLQGVDPDQDSPTFAFGISGETASGDSVSKEGTYGTLTVTPSTGAYTYVPNMTAIKPLDTGDDPVDSFALTVSDGSLSGSGTLNFTIDSVTDTEPSAPTITAVIPGDEHLTVLFDPPGSEGGNSITDYEYSTDGTNFVALGSVPTGGFAITALSSDGTTSLTNGDSYSITIRADNGQLSPVSNAASGTPTDTPAVSTPSIQSFEPSAAKTTIDNDFEVSGFGSTDNLLVTIGLTGQSSGTQAALPNFEASGATKGSGYSSYTDGDLFDDFAMTGTQTQVNAALAGLQLKTGSTRANFSVNVSASIVSGSILQSGSTQSFYEFVNSGAISWTGAKTAAESRTFAGVTGYLATITSAAENAFVASRIPSASDVWIGASDSTVEGDWRWVTGPEGQNGGTRFWYSEDSADETSQYNPPSQTQDCVATAAEATADGNPIRGSVDENLVTYACWATGEPNNYGSGEDAVVTNWSSSSGKWNDLPVTRTSGIDGYVVEYSEWDGQTFSSTSVVKSASSVSMGGPQLTASGAANAVNLSWTVPTRSGQSVSSYAVTSVPSTDGTTACSGTATSCTVSGLTAGTQYSFTVTATWSDSAESASNSASARALAAQTGGGGGGNDDDDEEAAPPVVSPAAGGGTPGVVPPRAATPPQANLPVTRQGPVLRNGAVPREVRAPEVRIGGQTTSVQSTVTNPSTLSVRAGVLSLGVQVQQDQGGVSQAADGTTEIAVRKGARTTLSGSGLRPESTVQVFLPLQGSNAKELTRIPVAADGSFNGDAAFATAPDEAPLPIGRQVLQLVSVDENGDEVVVDMTVNIAQPPPAPEFNRVDGVIPTQAPGTSIATNGGVPEEVRVSAVEDQKLAVVEGDGWSMAVGVTSENGAVEGTDGGASIKLVRDESARVSGDGFMPGTRADVWLFSDPTLLGTVTIDDEGRFDGDVNIDGRVITAGDHTLQLQGVGEDGYVRAANMGVTVDDPTAGAAEETAESSLMFIWWVLVALVLIALVVVFWVVANRRRSA